MLKYSTYYHGTDHRIERFMDDFVGGEKAVDGEGPGIYFTSDKDNAFLFGRIVYEVELSPRAVMTTDTVNPKVDRAALIKLAKSTPDWEMDAQNWDENAEKGLQKCIDSVLKYRHSVADIFRQMCREFYAHDPVGYVRNVVKFTKYDAISIDMMNGIEHVVVYNPGIIRLKKVHGMEQNEIRNAIRKIIREASAMDMAMHKQPTVAPAMAAGRTVDQEGLVAFLRQQGLFGNEEDLLSILEGSPNEKVMNDIAQYISFHGIGTDPAQLSADTMLDYYLQWNHLNIEKNQVLAFSISER